MSESRPPLVLHVIHHLATGGLENGLVNIINAMPADKYRHAVACIEDYSSFRERICRPDVEVIPLHRSSVGIWRVRRELFALCRRLRPAIVHTRNLSGLDALFPAMLAGVRHRVHGEHGWDVGDLHGKSTKAALLRKLHSPLVSRYVAVSQDLANYLQNRIGVSPSRITHICNGVDTSRFFPAESLAHRHGLRREFGSGDTFVVGTVGRIQPVKDQALLIRAFAAAVASKPALRTRLRLAVIGDGPLLPRLRDLVASLGIADLVWLPGAMNDVSSILRSLDLFVLPSLNEGISNTILEALASGVPVVATAVGGNPELVDDGVTGRLIPVGNLDVLREAITRYAEDPLLCHRQGDLARKVAIDRFELSTMVRRYENVYDAWLIQGG